MLNLLLILLIICKLSKKDLILSPVPYIIQLVLRGVAQVVERYFREVEAASSSLVTPTEGLRAAMFLNLFWYFKEYRNEIRGKRA